MHRDIVPGKPYIILRLRAERRAISSTDWEPCPAQMLYQCFKCLGEPPWNPENRLSRLGLGHHSRGGGREGESD